MGKDPARIELTTLEDRLKTMRAALERLKVDRRGADLRISMAEDEIRKLEARMAKGEK